ncbi:MAG: extracellular solute-binding protein [Kosmotoga sp.]|uniref:Extracellular solute-binding protein n=1 Tax=Kosmotoga arenicorallina TaxID=688066 RepID=A0A7C5DZN3_9BACT|nr:extracellular solute-binding protein [Kosmotoga sp.]MBO8166937.1 extracellular solute-binding protein [Kosmotoga sp.]HHF08583.1 extracellular solute-binding protein [Kosmotoga arenicorallina]
MKKLLLVLMLVAIAAFAFGKETLVVVSRLWTPPSEKEFVINEILKPFEEMYGVEVKFSTLDDQKILEQVKLQQETGNITTDVIIAYAANMPEWVDNGYVVDLTDVVSQWTDRHFSKGLDSMTVFNGKRYFLPIGADVYLFIANKKALPYLPEGADIQNLTWEQVAEWANAIALGEGEGKFVVTGVPKKSFIYQAGAICLSYGADWPNLDNPGAMAAFYLLSKMVDAFPPAVMTYDDSRPPLKRGEAWLAAAHCARVGEVYKNDPTNFIIAPVPKGPAGRGSVAGTSGLAIVKGTKHYDLAVKFLEYITRPDVMLKVSKGTGGFIPTVEEAIIYLGDTVEDEVIEKSIMVMKNGVLSYIAPKWKDWGQVKLVYDDIFKNMIMNGIFDPEYLEIMQLKIDALRK